jgi:hypothetical protein
MLTLAVVLLVAAPRPAPGEAVAAPREDVSRGPSGACAAVQPGPAPGPARASREASPDEATDQGAVRRALGGGPRFSAARTIDLRLGAVLRRRVAPAARLELRLYTPRGHLYQTLRATPPTSPPPTGFVPREPLPWTAALPVAGTAIVNHSLYGRWRVEPHLGGDPRPCGPAQVFWITP